MECYKNIKFNTEKIINYLRTLKIDDDIITMITDMEKKSIDRYNYLIALIQNDEFIKSSNCLLIIQNLEQLPNSCLQSFFEITDKFFKVNRGLNQTIKIENIGAINILYNVLKTVNDVKYYNACAKVFNSIASKNINLTTVSYELCIATVSQEIKKISVIEENVKNGSYILFKNDSVESKVLTKEIID